MAYLAIQIGGSNIVPPAHIPSGGLSYLQTIMRNFLMVFLFFGVCLVVIYITWGGVQWIMSGGDKTKLTAARAKITIAITGFITLLLSYAIVLAVGYFFKVPLLSF